MIVERKMAGRFFVVLMLGVLYVNSAVLKGTALYCRDPDTGKLHTVNSTWAGSSFCGNYTCNIRRRNATLASTVPIREFNVTNITDQKSQVTEDVTVTIEKKTEPDVLPLLHKIVTPDPRNVIHAEAAKTTNKMNDIAPSEYYYEQENIKPKGHKCKMEQKTLNLSSESDRYLTEKEIDNIADLLHTVKRSDLDAIVDIYNLAQDIYKEMDETTTEEIKSEEWNKIKKEKFHTNHDVKPPLYWYDTLANKRRVVQTYDINQQKTLGAISTDIPKPVSSNYFNRKLTNDDDGKTSFYYPVTQFQRIHSYTNPAHSYKVTTQNANLNRKFDVSRENDQNENTNIIEANKGDTRKLIQQSHYLPYPFTNIHPYNLSESRNVYYGSPWMLDYYNRFKYYQPYYSAYVSPIQKAVLINPHLNNEVQDVEQHINEPVVRKEIPAKDKDVVDALLKGQMTSNWKTDPVPMEVLKDIRADIDTSRLIKAFPLRKKIKLEKVGKLINMDDLNSQMNRNKRFVGENVEIENSTELGEFETYLERVTCRDQIKLGYFRIGNLTQPFPECCPQLIDTREV